MVEARCPKAASSPRPLSWRLRGTALLAHLPTARGQRSARCARRRTPTHRHRSPASSTATPQRGAIPQQPAARPRPSNEVEEGTPRHRMTSNGKRIMLWRIATSAMTALRFLIAGTTAARAASSSVVSAAGTRLRYERAAGRRECASTATASA